MICRNSARWSGLVSLLCLLLTGCTHAQTPQTLEPGVSFYGASQPTAVGTTTHLWVYLPANAPAKIPCVVIAPAGTPLIYGMDLSEGDRAEHLPYVRAGFAVVAYSIDGPVPQNPTSDEQVFGGVRAFRSAHAGVSDTFAAVDYVLAKLPQVDPKRVYVAGHSSAGTLALLAAASDPRIKACAAYAPACGLLLRSDKIIGALQPTFPDIRAFLVRTSPITRAADIHCPLFLFHARDDDNVPTSDVGLFNQKVSLTNAHVTFSQVDTGGHYDSMIKEGVPQAIKWFQALP